MISDTVTVSKSLRIPTMAEIQRRRSELMAQQAAQQSVPEPVLPPEDELDDAPSTPPPPDIVPWPTLANAAYHGLAGRAVRTIAPHTEADPAAILLQFLAAFGNIVGPGPHCMVESTRHNLNLFVVLVGESSKARKGTSWRHICRLFSEVDDLWVARRITSARLTADGLIHALRDQEQPTDRRLLVLSEEFAGVLHVLAREKGHLSPLLRCAWDSGNLRTLDRHRSLQATGAHISLIGHITQYELAQHLHRTEAHNGFANRCLWTAVRRSQCLPEGGSLRPEDLAGVARELRRTLDWVGSGTERPPFGRDAAARQLWNDRYPYLSHARAALFGAATSRAEAQVLRLSAIYAALDCSPIVSTPHLEAALAVWDYCSASAALIFIPSASDPIVDRIREALDASPDGLTRDQIRTLFQRHVRSDRIDAALEQLTTLGTITSQKSPGKGRPSTLWSAMEAGGTAPE
jgi:hypothetical protein